MPDKRFSYDEAYAIWAIGRKASMSVERSLYEAIQREVDPTDRTLEFGCGLSTFAFAASRDHTVVENRPEFCGLFKKTMHSPLIDGWYSRIPGVKFDVVLVDGPSLEDGGCRARGLDSILECCDERSVIFIDDVHREAELGLALALASRLDLPIAFYDRWAKVC